jgi:hypothetical protein
MKVLTDLKHLSVQYKSQYLDDYGGVTVLKINNSHTQLLKDIFKFQENLRAQRTCRFKTIVTNSFHTPDMVCFLRGSERLYKYILSKI